MDIHIFWEGPISLKDLDCVNDTNRDFGVYQIYGQHPLYGHGVLLYIGKAQSQTFSVRVKQEWWAWHCDAGEIKVYVGRLAGRNTITEDEWDQRIDQAEKLLIYAHMPAWNTQNTKTLPEAQIFENRIFNWESYRALFPEVSGARYTSKYDHIMQDHIFSYGNNIT